VSQKTYGIHALLDCSPGRTLLENANRVVVATNTIMGDLQGCGDLAVGEDTDAGLLESGGDGDVAGALLLAGLEVLLSTGDDGASMLCLDRVQAGEILARRRLSRWGGFGRLARRLWFAALEVGGAGAEAGLCGAAARRGPLAFTANSATLWLDAALDVVGCAWASVGDEGATTAAARRGGNADARSATSALARAVDGGARSNGAHKARGEQRSPKDGAEKLHLENGMPETALKSVLNC